MKWIAGAMLVAVTLLALSACADPNLAPVPFQLGASSQSVVLGPGLRSVTERPRPIPSSPETYTSLPTVCSEPSPDVAIAFGRSLAANANVSVPSGPTAAGAFSASQTEVATTLEGRTAGVLALRDGLSAACQAYVNGVIGQDAYALILSQYGNLLVALAGTGAAGSALPRFTAQETALSALLVSCISEHDPTRLGSYRNNPLLSQRRCERLLDGIAAGSLLRPGRTQAALPQKASLTASAVTINVAK